MRISEPFWGKEPAKRRFLAGAMSMFALAALAALAGCAGEPAELAGAEIYEIAPIADFVEPDFPFITTTIDARELDRTLPDDNGVPRAVVVLLEDSNYVAFDPDLLRMAVGWSGDFLTLTTMAQISYQDSLNKDNQIPVVLGDPVFATGLYPGWSAGEPDFLDPREPGPNPDDPGRGPLPHSHGRWEGIHLLGDEAVLSYTVGGAQILEMPGIVRAEGQVGITRDFQIETASTPLSLVAAEAREASVVTEGDHYLLLQPSGDPDRVIGVGLSGAPPGARIELVEGRYAVVKLPARGESSPLRVVYWRGDPANRSAFEQMLAQPASAIDLEAGGTSRWPERILTRGELAPDTAAYVIDRVELPVGNPWRRNVRPSDIAFFSDGRAAVSTFEGDIWIVHGLEGDLERLVWSRFASGLYEPMAVEIVDDEIYVYSRSGLIRLRDLDGDGEADFYENFSDLSTQSMESREFPLSMGVEPGGSFVLSRGAALDMGPRSSPPIMPGFRAGSAHAGAVVRIAPDGRSAEYIASGLREPFLTVHPRTGVVTASDQQGNFVPSTPIYRIDQGGYYGVPATAVGEGLPPESEALVWLPHEVDQSGAGQTWVVGGRMGFGQDALVHVSYGRPGAFRVYFDEGAEGRQGAAISLVDGFEGPLLKARENPRDGQLFVAGFQVWGTRSSGIRVLSRVRYTGLPNPLPAAVSAGEQGILLSFHVPLDPAVAEDVSRYEISRWNYQRTSRYGSGHYRRDGEAGEERMAVASAHLAPDRRTLLLVVLDMQKVMQMRLAYDLRGAEGLAMTDTLYLTVNEAPALALDAVGLGDVDWRGSIASAGTLSVAEEGGEASVSEGREIFARTGCVACHSVDGSMDGKLGPSMLGLFGAERPLADGRTVVADEAYLRRAIEEPGAEVVAGFQEGMPAYVGVLTDSQIESLVMYIRSLGQ